MMHCCIVSCVMSLHCIPARNNRVLGHCNGKVSHIPCFQAVETYCLKIFINICLLLSPSDPVDKSYFVPTYAVSFGEVHTGAGDILSESRFRTLLTSVVEASCRAHSRRESDSSGSFGPLSGKSPKFPFHLRVNPCSSEHGKLCFGTPGIIRASRDSSPQARRALYSKVVS